MDRRKQPEHPAMGKRQIVIPSEADLERSGRLLAEVMGLAESLPVEHDRELKFPRLPQQPPRP